MMFRLTMAPGEVKCLLLAPGGVFTSAPTTLALQALGKIRSGLEPAFLHAVHIACYVEGATRHDLTRWRRRLWPSLPNTKLP